MKHTKTKNKIVLLGGGGHARVIIDAIKQTGKFEIHGITDPRIPLGSSVSGAKVLGTDNMLATLFKKGIKNAFIAVGSTGNSTKRKELYRLLAKIGFNLPVVVHPRAVVARGVEIGSGTFIAAGAVVNPGTKIGKNAIINTRSSIDHDCSIGDFVHVAPGATLSGGIVLKDGAHIGVGANIIQGLTVDKECVVKSGALVTSNVKRDKSLVKIKKHWDRPDTVSLRDANLAQLERNYIIQTLETIGKVRRIADIGCGDGIDLPFWSRYGKEVLAYDYSPTMIEKARKVSKGKIRLFKADILKDKMVKNVDIVISKRCLINLGNFENQKKAIAKITNTIKKGGYLILVECSIEGLIKLNSMRGQAGLEPLPEPHHNRYFSLKVLKPFLKKYFTIEKIKYFSTYYFLTRVYNPATDRDNFGKLDRISRDFHRAFDVIDSNIVGPQFFMVLKKRK